jgi:aerobic carbon-monoxide dehydrogenase small subunit
MLKTFHVNGQLHEVDVDPDERLSDMLRNKLGLIGVRESCGEGECGTCTILVDGIPKTSCLMLAMQAEGREITTIEGLGTRQQLHPIQESFIEKQGFQCGFCTPGMILTTKAFLEKNPNPTAEEASQAISGSICRCGAYPYIVESVLDASEKLKGQCCRKNGDE